MSRLARHSLVTAVTTFVLIAVGGLVRATGSGLGCADEWPGCNGKVIPDFTNHHVAIEFSHRVLAAVVGGLVIGLVVGGIRRRKGDPLTYRLSLALLPLLALQGGLGAAVVKGELEAVLVVAHLAGAMAFLAVLLGLVVHLLVPPARDAVDRRTVAVASAATLAVGGLNLLGSYVTGRHAGLAYTDWPLMDGRLLPGDVDQLRPALQFSHRVAALVVGALLVWAIVEIRRSGIRRLQAAANVAAALFVVQVGVGAANVFTELNSAAVTTHLSLSVAIWGALVVTWALARRSPATRVDIVEGWMRFLAWPSVDRSSPSLVRARSKVAAYVALTKPRIIELLLVTTVPTMVVAEGGWPSTWLVVATVVGGTLAAGGANAFNMVLDRDIDQLMDRTKHRPLVTGEIADHRHAAVFAMGLELAAFAWLWGLVNLLSAVLALSATLFYVFVYTLWLKRSTTNNIVIGGAAGAVPVLVGWSAVTGSLGLAPLVLFAIIFYWTPPHFWALAIRYRDDYQAAHVPMLPAVSTLGHTARKVLLYTVTLWAVTLVLQPVAGLGDLYLAAAVLLGGVFTYHAARLWRAATAEARVEAQGGAATTLSPGAPQLAMRLFSWSITYLTLLFVAMAADRLVLG